MLPVQQAIIWTNVDQSSTVFYNIHLTAILQEVLMNLICNMCSKITILRLLQHVHLPGAIEFNPVIKFSINSPSFVGISFHQVDGIWRVEHTAISQHKNLESVI